MPTFNVRITTVDVFEVEAPTVEALEKLLDERERYAKDRFYEERWTREPDPTDPTVVWGDHFEFHMDHETLDVTPEPDDEEDDCTCCRHYDHDGDLGCRECEACRDGEDD